jgi:hypothetical protein
VLFLQFRANCFESARQWYAVGQGACGARISACGAAEHARCQAHAPGQAHYTRTDKHTDTLAYYMFFYLVSDFVIDLNLYVGPLPRNVSCPEIPMNPRQANQRRSDAATSTRCW